MAGIELSSADAASLIAELRGLGRLLRECYEPRTAYGESTADKLVVALDLRGLRARANVEVWVKSSAAADFIVEGSRDGVSWRPVKTISLSGAGERHEGYQNAYPVIRVRTEASNDNEIEIVASR